MCAIFGFIDYKNTLTKSNREKLLKILSNECMERGTDATGISYMNNGKLVVYKSPKPASKMKFKLPHNANIIMGHTRMTTQGTEKKNYNNHPFVGKVNNTNFAFAHNGVLHNDEELRESKNLPSTIIETDSYVAVQLLEQHKNLNFDSLRDMAENVYGSFCFTVMDDKSNIYIVKGENPICLIKFKSGMYLYASTKEIVSRVLKITGLEKFDYEVINVNDEDMLKISPHGHIDYSKFTFENQVEPYFGYRPYSYMYGYDDSDHIEDIKSVASMFGYSERDVDSLLEYGLTPDEIEDYFYAGA